MRQQFRMFEGVQAEPGEVLMLFRDGLSELERTMYLHRLFAEEYNRGRPVRVKQPEGCPPLQTSDGFGLVLEVPVGYENFYIALIGRDPEIRFAQRHHRVRALKTALPTGH